MYEITETIEAVAEAQIFHVATDWAMLWVTLIAGLLAAIATFIAVIYTQRKTSEQYKKTMTVTEQRYKEELARYEADKKRYEKDRAFAIIKPSLKYAAFYQIREKLILDDNEERVLLLSSKEGFDFYDDVTHQPGYHCIFSIRNDSENSIQFVNIEIRSKLKTRSDKEIFDEYKNVVKLLRKNEEILLRIHNTEQRKTFWECLEKNESVETEFECTINYLTFANQQIRYDYSIKIIDNPKKVEEFVSSDRKTEILKDEHSPIDEISINRDEPASLFRDLQDKLNPDRFGYKHQRIGEAQMNGTLDALHKFWKDKGMDEFVNNVANTADNMGRSMHDVANAVDEQRKFFENLTQNKDLQTNPQLNASNETLGELE